MRKFILTISSVVIFSVNLVSQWSTDPNNNLIVGYGLDPHICSDSTGGCYITYDYNSTSYPRWLAVERLDKYGYKPWGTLKRILGELPGQSKAQIVEDGEGGVIVSYEDRLENQPSWTTRIRVQRVDSNGNFLWGQTGVRVTTEEINQGTQRIVTDGNGGCVITWVNVPYIYYMNRIDRDGNRIWGDSGIVIGTSVFSDDFSLIRAIDSNYYIQTGEYIYRIRQNGDIVRRDSVTLGYIIPDSEGGIVLSGRVWTGMIPKLVAQRKDSLGNNLWQEPYVEIADSLYINTPINIKAIDGYYFYNWYGRKNGIELVTQYQALRPDGTLLFNQGSLAISNYPVDALIGNILHSDSGTFVLIWQDYRLEDGVFGQRRDTLGNPLWNLNDVSLYTGMYADLFAITDCGGGAIGLGWHQFDFSIRSFKVSRNGILGEVITKIDDKHTLIIPEEIILYQNFPNPFNSSTIIKYQITKEGNVKISIYNILGERLKILSDQYKSTGTYSIIFNSDNLPSGVYVYTLESDTQVLIKKLTIIK